MTLSIRRHMLGELGRQLAGSPRPALGCVATGAQEEDAGYRHGYAPSPRERREQPEHTRSET